MSVMMAEEVGAEAAHEQKIVAESYDGDVRRYDRDSFSSFIIQTYDE